MNTCMKCAHKNVCEWCIDDSEYDFPTCSDFLEERPQGEWVEGYHDYFETLDCSHCGYVRDNRHATFYFCPKCGAEMRRRNAR